MTPSPNLRTRVIEAMARSDAAFDGRPFDGLGRCDKQRYLDRAAAAIDAIAPLAAIVPREIDTRSEAKDAVAMARDLGGQPCCPINYELSAGEAAGNISIGILGLIAASDITRKTADG